MTLGIARSVTTKPLPPLGRGSSETALFHGYSRGSARQDEGRVEPCACGADIEVEPDETVALAVALHVRSEPHRSWSERTRIR